MSILESEFTIQEFSIDPETRDEEYLAQLRAVHGLLDEARGIEKLVEPSIPQILSDISAYSTYMGGAKTVWKLLHGH